MCLLAEEPDEEFENLLKSLPIDVMADEFASSEDDAHTSEMPIMCKRKVGKISYVSNAYKKPIQIVMELILAVMTVTLKTTITFKLLKRKILRYHLLLHCRC